MGAIAYLNSKISIQSLVYHENTLGVMPTLQPKSSQLLKVVYFAVEYKLNAVVLIADRLMAGANIDDRKPSMSKTNKMTAISGFRFKKTFIIGSTMVDNISHQPQSAR